LKYFFSLLESFEIAVCAYPELYPGSGIKKNIRRAVLSKVLSAFYRIHKGKIEVLAILDNRCDIGNWL
jgi:plasmid stabilization system protein ParE